MSIKIDGNQATLLGQSAMQGAPDLLAAKGFLFAASGSDIQTWKVDSATGSLTQVSTAHLPLGSTPFTVDPQGNFLYAVSGQSGQVLGFSIDAGGTLVPLGGSPYQLQSSGIDQAMTVSPDGTWLCGVQGLGRGSATSVECAPRDPSSGILLTGVGHEVTLTVNGVFGLLEFAADGYLVAAGTGGDANFPTGINVLHLTSSTLQFVSNSSLKLPSGLAADPAHMRVLAADATGSVHAYSFDSAQGRLTSTTSVQVPTAGTTTISADGKYAMVFGQTQSSSSIVDIFDVEAGLVQLTGSPITLNGLPSSGALF